MEVPDSHPEHIIALLTKRLRGECTSQELLLIEQLLAADPSLRLLYRELLEIDTLLDAHAHAASISVDTTTALTRTRFHLEHVRKSSNRQRAGVFSLLVMLLGLGFGYYFYTEGSGSMAVASDQVVICDGEGWMQEVDLSGRRVYDLPGGTICVHGGRLYFFAGADAARELEVRVPQGKQCDMELPDGSRIFLDYASRLRFELGGFPLKRRVSLRGHALFEVAKSSTNRFEVELGEGRSIEVLGTTFDVKHYQGESCLRVSLFEGAINLTPSFKMAPIALHSGEQVRLSSERHTKESIQDIRYAREWIRGVLSYREATMAEIFNDMQDKYGVAITCRRESLLIQRVSGSFENQSLDSMLQVLGHLADFSYSKQVRKEKDGRSYMAIAID